jgi:hypothetical protein
MILMEGLSDELERGIRYAPKIGKALRSGADGSIELLVPMNSNDIVLIKLCN